MIILLQSSCGPKNLCGFSPGGAKFFFLSSSSVSSGTKSSRPVPRPWKDHFKSDLRSVQDLGLTNDLRSDQDHIYWKNYLDLRSLSRYLYVFSHLQPKGCFYRIDELFFHSKTPNYINCFLKTANVAVLPEPEKKI
jgi:hypothetical protein